MADISSENDHNQDDPVDVDPEAVSNGEEEEPLSRRFVIACWSLLIVPTALPLAFIPGVQNLNTALMLAGLSAMLLVSNGLVLVVMIRWVKRVRADR